MEKKRQKSYNIYLSNESRVIIDSYPGTRSNNIRRAVDLLALGQCMLYQLTCETNDMLYIGICDVALYNRRDFVQQIQSSNDLLDRDVKEFGCGEFTPKFLSLFANRKMAMEYREILLNILVNDGKIVYNTSPYAKHRILFLKVSPANALKITEFCNLKNISISRIVVKLFSKILKDK